MQRKRILHLTMSMNIGGAETHILELMKYLKAQDYDVMVASNGGVYVKDLTEAGIKHFNVPLHTKSPRQVLQSFHLLRKIIKEEKIDLVHAHARIPAFIAGIICKQLRVKIVTTTHFTFKVNFIWRKLTNWGDKSIAVSEDIREYLLREYDYKEENVYLSVNGIDTKKFSRQHPLDKKPYRITQVSRLDAGTSQAARFLIEMAPHLEALKKDLEIIIVGGGTALGELKLKANQVNEQIGKEVIIMTGPVTNIPAYLEKTHLFVGISRSALEAMNYEIPIILAGDYGMTGYLTQDKLAACEAVNFTGRGFEPLTLEGLKAEIIKGMSTRIGDHEWQSDYMEANYSVARMARPYMELYNRLFSIPKSYVLAGYYGYHNSGDDALLAAICQELQGENPDNIIRVLTKEPYDHLKGPKISFHSRFNFYKVLRLIAISDVLVMGGGSLVQDKTSSRSVWYYLFLMAYAKKMGTGCYMYANGIGPIHKRINRYLAKKVLSKVDIITLREKMSMRVLAQLKIDQPIIEVTADPVFALKDKDFLPVDYALKKLGMKADQPYIVCIFRDWEMSKQYRQTVAKLLDYIEETYHYQILFLPLKFPEDSLFEEKIGKQMERPYFRVDQKEEVEHLMAYIHHSHLVLSMRLHGILYSALAGVPVIGFSYDVKVNYYIKALQMSMVEDIRNMELEEAKALVDDVLANYDQVQKVLVDKTQELKAAVHRNASLLSYFNAKEKRRS